MTDRPILFSAPMIRALLAGTKTQTRRLVSSPLVKCLPGDRLWVRECFATVGTVDPGWTLYRASGYDAECARHGFDRHLAENTVKWTPSIHMPRRDSRLALTVTDVRVERLQEITEADAIAEGIPRYATVAEAREWGDDLKGIPTDTPDGGVLWDCSTGPVDPDAKVPLSLDPRDSYRALWDSLNAKRGHGWAANPYVVALTFAVHHANIDKLEG